MELRQLVLLRHAKSSWDDPNLDDHDRDLNPRGQRAATRIGGYIRDKAIVPDLVLCSSALRTCQTLELLHLDGQVRVLIERGLYGAGVDHLLGRLRQLDHSVMSVLLVGHNPGVQELAIILTADQERLVSFPTAAIADLQVPLPSWDELGPGSATLKRFVNARDFD